MQNKCAIEDTFIQDTGFNHIKQWLKNHCNCQENGEYFETIHPISDLDKLNQQLYETDELFKQLFKKNSLIETKLGDISKSIVSLNVSGDFIDINEFNEIRKMLFYHLDLKKYFKSNEIKLWGRMFPSINESKSIIKKINKVVDDKINIKENASKELKEICKCIKQTQLNIESQIQHELNKYIKLGYLRDNKTVFRSGKILLPVNVSSKNKVKGIIDSFSSTGQTCFIQPISLVELNNKMNELISDKKKEILKILIKLTKNISSSKEFLDEIYILIKYYDRHYTIANFAIVTDAIKPEFKDQLILKDATNPLFILNKKKYIPLNISVKNRNKTIVISGPNSGGKTIVIKSIGLYCLMAQCGIYIPSKQAIMPIFKSFLSDIGDKQSLSDDLSTFSAHMKGISNILNISDKHSLIIIDEMGTGTDPDIGSSLSISILKKLTENESFNLCTTHLAPLKVWANDHPNADNASMEFDNKKIQPTFIFQMGVPGASYGIEIAERMGVDNKIIKDANLNLNQQSFTMETLIKKLNDKQKKITKKIDDLNKQRNIIESEKKIFNDMKQTLEKEKKQAKQKELSESKEYILSYRKKIESLIENIKHENANKLSIKNTKKFIDKTLEDIDKEEQKNIESNYEFNIGDYAKIKGLNDTGIIISINKKIKNAILEVDGKRVQAKINNLIIASNEDDKQISKYIINTKVEPLQSQRLDLRGKRVDEALMELDKFLDRAILSNLKKVDILHGKGTGALQESIHDYLSKIKFIEKFNFAPIDQGGTGITIVEIS